MPVGRSPPVRDKDGTITQSEATAEVFYTGLKALPKEKRDAVLVRIAKDKAIARDLLDLATIAARWHERSRPLREYLARKRRAR